VDKIQTRNRLAAIIALLVVLFWAGMVDPEEGIITNCFFLKKTGYPCPTCGMSRSIYTTFHFNFQDAFHYHHLGPVLVLMLLIVLAKFSWELLRGKEIQIGLKSQYIFYLFYIFASLMMLRWFYVLFTSRGN
jgi:hypothetical protein